MEEIQLAHCPDCGADVEFAEALHSTDCPFCTTPVVVDTGLTRRIKPQALIPFQISERTARARIRDWLSSHRLAPDALPLEARENDPLQGVYVPVWSFDVPLDVRYAGKSTKRTFTKEGKWETGARGETSGRVIWTLEDLHIHASTGLPEAEANRLNPWDLAGLRPYRPAYLSGFRAEAYQADLETAATRAQTRLPLLIDEVLKQDIKGTHPCVKEKFIEQGDMTYRLVMLPIWVYAYRFRDTVYRVTVNGQTAEVRGEVPTSGWKQAWDIVRLVAVLGAFFGLMLFLMAHSQ